MLVLVTENSGRLLDERADRVDPAVEQVRMNREGGLTVDGREVDAGSVQPEVACATGDLFFRGGAAPWFELLLSLESLRWFQSPAAGYLPLYDRLFERGVRVTGAHVNAIPIAEYVIQAVLARFQRADEWAAARAAHEWRPHEFREVFGTTWLVIGVGSIGSAVAERARALGARVLGHRRHPTGREPVDEMLPREALLDELPGCDVVVLAAPATADTTGFVDGRFLAAMAPDSVLVNVARGALVDEAALLAALDRSRPAAAILDVFATEPLPADSPIWDHPGVVLTPHSSAGGLARHGRVVDLFVENLERYRNGQPLLHEVRPAAGEATQTWLDERAGS
ncbi:MAG TPA: D-2-hydroxyacid dehydrogenase [Acidimicrobiia bacterium]|nr:D-2-hydroxyacid dehydrogenase [Acidimicrobiia bacterium]